MKTSLGFFARPPVAALSALLLAGMILISRGDAQREWRTGAGERRQPAKEARTEIGAPAKISSALLAGNVDLPQSLVSGGGGASAGGNKLVEGSAGLSVVGSSSGGNFTLDGGFWHGAGAPCAGAAITLSPNALPGGVVSAVYSQTISALPTGSYTFALAQGALPPGLSLDGATGVISGAPAQPGAASFTIRATDANGCSGVRAYMLTINCPTITFSPQTLADGEVGALYTQTVIAGPAGAYSYVVDQGSLPPGLTLNSTTGVISGAPEARGSFGFSVRALLSSGPCFGARAYQINVACPSNLAIAPSSLPNAQPGVAYSQQLMTNVTSGGVSFRLQSGALPAGLSLSSGGLISGAPVTTGVASFTVEAIVANGCAVRQSYTLTVNDHADGPVDPSPAPDQRAGSALVYNLYTSSASSPNAQNTRINLTNTNETESVAVHLFFINGANCSIADAFICLTRNQTASFFASDLDPGTTGYVIAVAVDRATGCPVKFNYLIGDGYVKFSSGHAANLGAEAFAALADNPSSCNANSTTARLNFDGASYGLAPRALALSNIASRESGNETLLVINRFGGNLLTGAPALGAISGALFNDTENGFSFTFNSDSCQLRGALSNNFPRTAPPFTTVIPADRSGWMKLWSADEIALLGAAINFNQNARSSAGAFNQGHNLHKLTLTNAASLTIPVFPPPCGP